MSAERCVLVAEDSLVVRALLRAQLRERGYAVVEAADGEQALVRARESEPDVILLDVEMPGMDGFGVLAELRRDPLLADVPVVFITGRAGPDEVVRGLESGAHDYLRKPFEAAELAARVHAAMRTKELHDELRLAHVELARQATTDALTGLPNRRLLEDELTRLVSRSARHRRPLALLLLDVDGLAAVNASHGHAAGDAALVAVARRLARRLRREDLLGRWGGDEFAVLAPDVDEAGAHALAAGLREAAGARPLGPAAGDATVTLAAGVASWRGEDADELLRRATASLREVKARA